MELILIKAHPEHKTLICRGAPIIHTPHPRKQLLLYPFPIFSTETQMKERIVCVVHGGTVFAGSRQKQQNGPEESVRLYPGLHNECQKGDPGDLFQVPHPSFASQEERGLLVFRLALRLKAETQRGPLQLGRKELGNCCPM